MPTPESSNLGSAETGTRTCRFCAEDVTINVQVCPHCGEPIGLPMPGGMSRQLRALDPEILLIEYQQIIAARRQSKKLGVLAGLGASLCTAFSIAMLAASKNTGPTSLDVFAIALNFLGLGLFCLTCSAIARFKGHNLIWSITGMFSCLSVGLMALLRDRQEERLEELKIMLRMLGRVI